MTGRNLCRSKATWGLASFFIVAALLTFHLSTRVSVEEDGTFSLKGKCTLPEKPSYSCPYFVSARNLSHPIKHRCATCAVVSSSGTLRNANVGTEIDSHACVFRMNTSPIGGQFLSDVGEKTTFRVICKNGFYDYASRGVDPEEEKWVIWDESIRIPRQDRLSASVMEYAHRFPQSELYLLNAYPGHGVPGFRSLVDVEIGVRFTGSAASTGFYTVQLAGYMCDSITVYGVVPPDYCRGRHVAGVPYHYYQSVEGDICHWYQHTWAKLFTGHKYSTEHHMFKRWSEMRDIRFRVPDW